MDRQQQIEVFLLASHRLAVSRLREKPAEIERARRLLQRWREQDGTTRSDPYWDEWERLLEAGPEAIERVVCAEGDHAAVLRSVSPLGILVSQGERAALIADARKA
jgi:hypothetical protein